MGTNPSIFIPSVPFHEMPIFRKECNSSLWMDQSSLFYNPINRYDAVNSVSPYVTMVTP